MAIEVINIRVYDSSGAIDASLSPAISLYDNSDSSLDFSGTMTWNATLQQYQYSPNIDVTKTYTATVDFGTGTPTRYTSFAISYTGPSSGALTTLQDQNLTRAAKALTLPQFIALQNP